MTLNHTTTLKYTTSTANTNAPIKIEVDIASGNAFTIQRVMASLGLGYGKEDSAAPTYTIYTSQFTRSFNPLERFSFHFPAFETERIEQSTLTNVLTAVYSLSKEIGHNPAYITVMGRFCALVGGDLPPVAFEYNYPRMAMRPYLPHWFGESTQMPLTYSMKQQEEWAGYWLGYRIKRFYAFHFLRIGLLAQQYVHALDLPHTNP